jgi:hypothetical protein
MGLITLLNSNISPVIFQKRSHAFKQQKNQPRHLLPFVGHHPLNMPKGLAYQLLRTGVHIHQATIYDAVKETIQRGITTFIAPGASHIVWLFILLTEPLLTSILV